MKKLWKVRFKKVVTATAEIEAETADEAMDLFLRGDSLFEQEHDCHIIESEKPEEVPDEA